ncbi:hypothetical protein [Adlercreutzia sp. ZJ141]|uniref:hypothetical protein n=1 Tax=Adlercreutzia sp. ZJ141 TaxID=2709406 RepID=UPI001F14B346|nr:hypothetical protein [Adlercreutzia sp. ZJ141]
MEAPEAAAMAGTEASTSEGAADTTSAAPVRTTFAQAMDRQKGKSRRRIPTLVLVALVTLALSGIAYAAYRVYTDVIAPQQQEQQADPIEQAEPAQPQEAKEPTEPEEPDLAQQAETAYADVVDEFRQVIDLWHTRGESFDDTDFNSDYSNVEMNGVAVVGSDLKGFQYVPTIFFPLFASNPAFWYCIEDIDSDGIPELIVMCDSTDSDLDSADGMCIFTYYNNEVKPLAQGWDRYHYILCKDGGIINKASGGAWTGEVSYYVIEKGQLVLVESYFWDGDAHAGSSTIIHTLPDGTKVTESSSDYEDFSFMSALEEQHPIRTDTESFNWISLE